MCGQLERVSDSSVVAFIGTLTHLTHAFVACDAISCSYSKSSSQPVHVHDYKCVTTQTSIPALLHVNDCSLHDVQQI